MVTGLTPSDNRDDIQLFRDMCEECFDIKPFVQEDKCKRIGRKIEGKVQPLLLVLTNIDSCEKSFRMQIDYMVMIDGRTSSSIPTSRHRNPERPMKSANDDA